MHDVVLALYLYSFAVLVIAAGGAHLQNVNSTELRQMCAIDAPELLLNFHVERGDCERHKIEFT